MTVLNKLISQEAIALENKHGANNYHPLPVVLSKGEGVNVWDVEGKKYYDFLSAYSAVNQGHCHPKIVDAMTNQAKKLSLTSRAFHNDMLGQYEKFATEYFGFDKLLPMNTGAEAVETALKIARKWAYEVKGIEENKAEIIVCENNFHGRTTTIISFSNDEVARKNFGPYTNGFIKIAFNNPLPLTDFTKSFVLQNSVNSCLNIFPNLSALIANSSSATTSKAAIATAAAIGFPPNVEPWLPGPITFITASFAKTAETGYAPPLRAFPKIKISGFVSGEPEQFFSGQAQLPQVANKRPVLAIPVCTSSAINKTLCAAHISLAAAK